MTDKPIIFSAPMIRALLDGSKTQTRRVVKPQPPAHVIDFSTFHNPKGEGLAHFGFDPVKRELQDWFAVCPYGQPGDRLWVREAFMHTPAEYEPMMSMTVPLVRAETSYRADFAGDSTGLGWKPSIHMPRNLSRITLEVVSVRVERLQDISEDDAMAEGIHKYPHQWRDCEYPLPDIAYEAAPGSAMRHSSSVAAYRDLWEQINGLGSWEANPWVWVVEFRKVTP